jgi:predicted DNA-binding antitoxin AbrB/MazE fold protein
MTITVDATFEGGMFKPLPSQTIELPEGQQVTLNVESVSVSEDAAASPRVDIQAGPVGALALELERLKRNQVPQWISPELADQLKKITEQSNFGLGPRNAIEQSRASKVLESLNEGLEYMTAPRVVVDAVKEQFKRIVEEVRDIRPAEPKNKMQRVARTMLAYFNNASSFFVYLILIAGILKLLFLFAAHSSKIAQAIDNAKYTLTPLALIVLLLCLLGVRGLHKISSFVRSYRVMSIIGCAIAIKFMIKTSIVLFTATSLSSMGAAAWQLFTGALR